MMMTILRNIGAYLRTVFAGYSTTADSAVAGAWVDRFSVASPKSLPLSGVLVCSYSTTLASGETLTVSGKIEDATSNAGAGAADYQTIGSAVVATGPNGGGTVTGTVEVDINLSTARQFIRPTLTLATSSTGTVAFTQTFIFAAGDKVNG